MRFRLYQLKRKLIQLIDAKTLLFLKYILLKKPRKTFLLHSTINAFPKLFSFITFKINFISDHKGYQVYESESLSYNYGYVDLETGEREIVPVRIKSIGYLLFPKATIIAGSEFVFKGSTAVRQEYLKTNNFQNTKYAVFHGGILNNMDYLLTRKLVVSEQVLPKGVFISGPHEQNWYHWLIEILPKLYMFTKIRSEFRDYKIIVAEDVLKLPTHRQSLECFINLEDVIAIDRSKSYLVEKLLVVEAPFIIPTNAVNITPFSLTDCFTHYGIMKSFKNYLERQLSEKKDIKGIERVFLYRNQKNRKYNQDQVLSLLEAYDFKAIDLSNLNFFEQMQVINNAKLIVGTAGAAWANILFCSSNTNCIIFRPHNTGNNPFLNNLSELSKSKIYEIRYLNPLENWRNLRSSNAIVKIDIQILEQLVVRLTS